MLHEGQDLELVHCDVHVCCSGRDHFSRMNLTLKAQLDLLLVPGSRVPGQVGLVLRGPPVVLQMLLLSLLLKFPVVDICKLGFKSVNVCQDQKVMRM